LKHNQPFPAEFINSSIENYTFKYGKASRAIYLLICFTIVFILVALPFIRLDVTVNTNGVVSSDENRHAVVSPVFGKVKFSGIKENREVKTGDTLIVFDSKILEKQNKRLSSDFVRYSHFENDLLLLTQLDSGSIPTLGTSKYQSELIQYLANHERLQNQLANEHTNYLRQKSLFIENIISRKTFEVDELKYKQAKNEISLFNKQNKSRWQSERVSVLEKKDQIQTELNQISEEKLQRIVISRVGGTLQNTKTIKAGQFLHPGDKLADISLTTDLIATCWVQPSKIGLLQEGQQCFFRIDAFNFYEWGMLEGKILEISNDAYLLEDNRTVFMVKCNLNQNHLALKNGFKGYVKKGMTFQSNFIVTQRTIFQLLYDKVDSWLNPGRALNTTAL
jgi:multidrug resistance efflux pump